MKIDQKKQIKMIILILQLILYILALAGVICVMAVKKLSFLEGVPIFLLMVISAIGRIVIKKK